MKLDEDKIQRAVTDLETLRNVSFYQPEIYNSLRLAENILRELLTVMREEKESLKFKVEIVPEPKGEE